MSNTLPLPLDRKINLSKDIDASSVESVAKEIQKINDNDRYLTKLYNIHDLQYTPRPIEIYIDSYGGHVYQIRGLISIVRESTTPIYTYATGCAMSAGFLLLINGHRRFAYKLSTVLYHQVSSGAFGKLQDMEERVEEAKRLYKISEAMVIEKTKITKKQLKENKERKQDWFMDAKEALRLGVIDEII